jgi:uncharacterized protein YlbG (UPF0298 family)
MRTNQLDSDFNRAACRFNNCLAYQQYEGEQAGFIYIVFTDISYKRFKASKGSWQKTLSHVRKRTDDKIVFITNKQLMDFTHPLADYHFMKTVRSLVFDAKLGTRYEAKKKYGSSTGSYFWCLSSDTIEIYPRKRVRRS